MFTKTPKYPMSSLCGCGGAPLFGGAMARVCPSSKAHFVEPFTCVIKKTIDTSYIFSILVVCSVARRVHVHYTLCPNILKYGICSEFYL